MINDALAALMEVLSPPFRAVLIKVLGLTVLILAVLVGLIHHVLIAFVALPYPWLDTTISVLAGLGLVIGSIFLVAPVSSLVAGFFIDDLAELVERDIAPDAPPGRPLPILQALVLSVRFAGLSLGVTILALLLLLVPGVNAVAFIGANAYLLGRQYFEFVALRHMRLEDVNLMRQRHGGRLWAAGLILALFVSVPLLNLLTPLFGAAFMVRVFKRLPQPSGLPAARSRAG